MGNAELRLKLKSIEARRVVSQLNAKPIRDEYDAKLRPFIEYEKALDQEQELLLDAAGDDIAGHCEGCSTIILGGDRYTSCTDGPILCLECSPTWAESAEHMRSYTCGHPDDDAERLKSIAHAEAQIAAGRGDEKVC